MDLTGKIKPGMRIVGDDCKAYGTVDHYNDTTVFVAGRPIPYAAFERVDRDHLYVGRHGEQYFHTGHQTVAGEGEVRVPLVEERLAVEIQTVELGDVEVRKSVASEPVTVPVDLRRDQIKVHQLDVDERPITIGEGMDAFQQDVIRVPVRGEEALVSKEAVVTGEVAVGREQISEQHTISETLRQDVIDVDTSLDGSLEGTSPETHEGDDRVGPQRDASGATFRARDLADAEPRSRPGRERSPGMVRDVEKMAPAGQEADTLGEREEVFRVSEVEERLRIERRRIALGFVEIRKTVVTEQVMVPVQLRREVVEYRLINDPGGVATIGEPSGGLRDDTVRIPVFAEKPVVNTEIVVTSEVFIDRTLTTERVTVEDTLRRATVSVEDNTTPWEPMRRRPAS